MGYISFNKEELVNLEYSLKREILTTNRSGGYASTTIVGCNTRKYHGLLVLPIEAFGGENHVLLSSLDETIVQHDQPFNLGIHKFPGTYEPRGHKYVCDVAYDPIFAITYRVGGVLLKKELMMVHNAGQVLIRYTLLEAHSDTLLRLKPFLAFRNIHELSHANMVVNTRFETIPSGICSRLYVGFPGLNMQTSKPADFVAVPDWYYQIEYLAEKERGYDFQEDLFVPGYFEFPMKVGEQVVFSASVTEKTPAQLKRQFNYEVSLRPARETAEDCLRYSASQFIVKDGKDTEVVAGYPWFGRWGRDTFIALPGLTLAGNKDVKSCKAVLDSMSRQLYHGLFPNIGKGANAAYNSVDAPMWYFWTLQQYEKAVGSETADIWVHYGKKMREILEAYRDGINPGARMESNALVWMEQPGKALSWMDAVVCGIPVTPRAGYPVEINALWYNAICYAVTLAEKAGETHFVKEWSARAEKVKQSFVDTFWNDKCGYLADYVDRFGQNLYIRPNQVIACSLPYTPISNDMIHEVLQVVKRDLLTPRGLRTLSPRNPLYKGVYEGSQNERDSAYHQGTVWPWLLGPFIEANLKIYGSQFVNEAKVLLRDFESEISTYGVCSLGEIYDGNPPHFPEGAPFQAWSVAAWLRAFDLVRDCENQTANKK